MPFHGDNENCEAQPGTNFATVIAMSAFYDRAVAGSEAILQFFAAQTGAPD
jgi:hypothetical protein